MTCGYVLRGVIWGRRRPLCVRGCRVSGFVRSTDEHGPAHGRGPKRPRTGPVGAVMLTVPARIPTLTCHFRIPAAHACLKYPQAVPALGAGPLR